MKQKRCILIINDLRRFAIILELIRSRSSTYGVREENGTEKKRDERAMGPDSRLEARGSAGTRDLAWMFCLGGQTLIPCRAPRCSTTKTRGHPPILSTSSPRSLSTRYAFILPAPRVWVMLLFIKPSFVNELNEGEGGTSPSHHSASASPRPRSYLIFNFSPSPLSCDHFSRDASTSTEDACDFFLTGGLSAKFPLHVRKAASYETRKLSIFQQKEILKKHKDKI